MSWKMVADLDWNLFLGFFVALIIGLGLGFALGSVMNGPQIELQIGIA